MDVRKRIEDVGRSAALLGVWVLIASIASIVINLVDAAGGNGPAISRTVLGSLGLAAAALFWSGRNYGRDGLRAIIVWGAFQIPHFASTPDGSYTEQWFNLMLGLTSQSTFNGRITQYSEVGVNVVGLIITIWALSCRDRLDLWRRRST